MDHDNKSFQSFSLCKNAVKANLGNPICPRLYDKSDEGKLMPNDRWHNSDLQNDMMPHKKVFFSVYMILTVVFIIRCMREGGWIG